MAQLLLNGKQVRTVFHLLGEHENDLTYSLGWALVQSPSFMSSLVHSALSIKPDIEKVTVRLQQSEGNAGVTDIEVESPGEFFLLIEAKRGWNLPTIEQLDKYSKRKAFRAMSTASSVMAVLSECSDEYVRAHLDAKSINGIKIESISWKRVAELAAEARYAASHAEKRILTELLEYLESLMTMQNSDSNWSYVVSIGSGTAEGWKLSWIDIVEKRRQYFHPVGNGWPKEPPNYIAFRYYGRLQSIHHIESYSVFDNPHDKFSEAPSEKWAPHFLYSLSEPFAPVHEVKTGSIYRNGRVWCMLDTLFLAKTISEARDMSRKRSRG